MTGYSLTGQLQIYSIQIEKRRKYINKVAHTCHVHIQVHIFFKMGNKKV